MSIKLYRLLDLEYPFLAEVRDSTFSLTLGAVTH